ncbi:alpha-mannosidase [Luteimicrobium sp. DT211]|uniref:alpha-mannosidase n=1 Tax=Luteimicrobium sp. DT211 TaxID=3393412 RepID=UPI003CEEE7A1
MHLDPQRVVDRTRRVLTERVWPAAEVATAPLAVTARALAGEPEPFDRATDGPFTAVRVGDPWGPAWTTTWFRVSGDVPAAWAGRTGAGGGALRTAAMLDIGFDADAGPGFQCEGLVFDTDGQILKGIHPRNKAVAVTGSSVDLFVEAAANPDVAAAAFRPTHLGDGIAPDGPPLYRLKRADVALVDPAVEALAYDLDVLLGWAERLPADRPRRGRILASLAGALDALDLDDVAGTAAAARAELAEVLAQPAEASAHRVAAVGHAHIDSAWLWPTRETVRKCTRTFSNVIALMDDYPELRFACSQAQQYAWIEESQPDLFASITKAVDRGAWIPAGGMWVESDTNMPGGEALVRQFLHGKRYFAERFGVDPEEVWLPDSFGYTAALPQIAKLAGYRWFVTQKLSWGAPQNKFPHHTFWWEGIDGTRLFSHLPPVDTYLSELSAAELDHAVSNFAEHPAATTSMVPFGHGDGGGGPTALMMERARRQADLEGSPTIEHATPEEFFRTAEAEYADAPTWVGELYLEAHRGTYTSQAATKRGNRRSEHLLREAELWSAVATVRHGVPYPYEALDRLWKTVLLHQFHDILPGSSIAWVHREAAEAYEEVRAELEGIIGSALDVLAGEGSTPIAFNAAPTAASGVPALGAGTPAPAASPAVTVTQDGGTTVLDNGVLRVTIDGRGVAPSVVDLRHGRELVLPGRRLGELVLHQDLPNAFDAWDLDEHYRGSGRTLDDLDDLDELRVERGAAGEATVVVTRSFGSSTATQRTTLRPGAATLDYDTEVDWHEAERILKVAFPVDVLTDTAASEIQFGHVVRPTHANTTWDAAKFETCAHRWVHVGEPGFGVAVANDATYGHDIHRVDPDGGGRPGTEVRLSLLRAPRYPDPEADQGTHRFSYQLVSGAAIEDAVDAGYRLNLPLRERAGAAPVTPLVAVSGVGPDGGPHGVVVESVKLAEDRSGDLVVRLYESLGARTRARVGWDAEARGASVVDLLERELEQLADARTGAELELRPFQIVTLRIHRGSGLEEEIG